MIAEREIDFGGWMFKKGKRIKNWKQRWFELSKEKLEYYEIENGEKPINTISLTKEAKLEVLHDQDAPHDNIFLLETEARDWFFCVESRKEMDQWLTNLKNNIPNTANRSFNSSVTADTQDFVVEGFLEKTGKWHTAWKKRWCKLIPNQKELFYYTVTDSKKSFKDKIDLNQVTVIDKVFTKGHPHGFVLVTRKRRYKFAAENEEELQRWFEAISPCVGGKQEQSLRDKQGLLQTLLQIKYFPLAKSELGNIALPDWLWHEVLDLMGNIDAPQTLEQKEYSSEDGPETRATYRPGLVVHLMEDTSTLSYEAGMKLLEDARQSFLKKPLLIDVHGPIYVIGELNGDLDGLINIFETLGTPPETRYMFLGNIIGMRPQSLGVALLLLALKIYYPEDVHIIRGKMEDQIQSRDPRGTLYDECLKQFGNKNGREMWKEFVWLFDHMPICAVLNKTIFAVSSGLSQNITKVGALRRGKIRPLYIARTNAKKYPPGRLIGSVIVRDFLYNVPTEDASSYKEQKNQSDRGLVYYQFGRSVLNNFLQANRFNKVIRSGQVDKSDTVFRIGQTTIGDKKLISLSSSANYNASVIKNKGVKGAVMFLEQGGEEFTFHTFKPDC